MINQGQRQSERRDQHGLRTNAYGVTLTRFTARHARSAPTPISRRSTRRRVGEPVITTRPDPDAYDQAGLYVQDSSTRSDAATRRQPALSGAEYHAEASGLLVGGQPLWPDDELRVSSPTYRVGGIVTFAEGIGDRQHEQRLPRPRHHRPGTLADGSGPARPTSPGSAAQSAPPLTPTRSTDPVRQPDPISISKGGFHMKRGWFETEIRAAVTNPDDNIAKQTLILPAGAVARPSATVAQNANGAVWRRRPIRCRCARQLRPRPGVVRGDPAFDLGASLRLRLIAPLRAEDRDTGRPPNIEGGTPPPEAYLLLRWAPKGRTFWVEPYLHVADTQTRLSTLDLGDRRTGASRSVSSIASFFNNGARARGLIGVGGDLTPGTADDILLPTGETLAQVQSRVLGPGLQSSSLYTEIPSYTVFGVRGGIRFGANELLVDLENLGDENYRGPSGMDAPGRGSTCGSTRGSEIDGRSLSSRAKPW
jgi:hemoglobin/transferrin/lactoferrin receptor protein